MNRAPDTEREGRRAATVTWIVVASAVGLALRAWDLGDQVVLGDESHTIKAAARHGPAHLASHYYATDASIPLALWDWVLLRTVGLEEWGLRLPVVLAGVLAIPAVAGLTRACFGRLEGVVAAFFAASLPLAIFYSRFARPYGLVVLFLVLALVGWHGFVERRTWRSGVLFAVSSALAAFSHVTSAPAVVALWILFAAFNWGRRSLLVVAVAVGVAAALFAPGLASLMELVSMKSSSGPPTPSVWWRALHALFGTQNDSLLCWLLASSLVGLASGFRRCRWLVVALAGVTLAQIAGVQTAGPFHSSRALVAARYSIAGLPAVIVLTSIGLAAQARAAGWLVRAGGERASQAATGLFVLLSLLSVTGLGPLPLVFRPGNVFSNDTALYATPGAPWTAEPERFPDFYRALEESEDELTLIEAPWARSWSFAVYAQYHYRHGHEVRVASTEPMFGAPGVRFRSVLFLPDLARHLDGVDYVIVHKNLRAERDAISRVPMAREDSARAEKWRSVFGNRGRQVLEACRAMPELQLVHEDEWIAAFTPR